MEIPDTITWEVSRFPPEDSESVQHSPLGVQRRDKQPRKGTNNLFNANQAFMTSFRGIVALLKERIFNHGKEVSKKRELISPKSSETDEIGYVCFGCGIKKK